MAWIISFSGKHNDVTMKSLPKIFGCSTHRGADRRERDIFRGVVGDQQVVFVVLDISVELVKERLAGREESEDAVEGLVAVHFQYKPPESDEPRTVGFEILDGTTKEENAQRIVELIDKECA